jgi:3-oxoacyl-[acyl-carrier protein] reductase
LADLLVDLGARPGARRVARALGLPIPLPQRLRRAEGPVGARPLEGRPAWVGGASAAGVQPALARALFGAGAEVALLGDGMDLLAWRGAAEGFARRLVVGPPADERFAALIFDATGVDDLAQLGRLHAELHGAVGRASPCARVVVLGRPPDEAPDAAAAAARRGLLGFVKSLGKELGGQGATVNLLQVAAGAEPRLIGPLRFLVSEHAAFVSGQALEVDACADGPEPAAPEAYVAALRGKVALVTGAAMGIGADAARRLAEEGARVVLVDRPEAGDALRARAAALGGEAVLVDLLDPRAVDRIAAALPGGVDVVVHNAGITRDKTLARMDRERWDQVLAVNLEVITRLHAALEPGLRRNGRVITVSSVGGLAGNPGQTAYAFTKAALLGWVAHVAPGLAHRGITVNAVAPGFIETRMTAAMPAALREAGRRLSSLGQGGLPVDVAEAITFLASPGAVGITGRHLRVCGQSFIGA